MSKTVTYCFIGLLASCTLPNGACAQQLASAKDMPIFELKSDQILRGVIRSHTRVNIASEMIAVVKTANFREGMEFKQGDILIAFDCAKIIAQHKGAQADQQVAAQELMQKEKLQSFGAAGSGEVKITQAKLERAKAEVELAGSHLADCTISAPFSGAVVRRFVAQHEIPEAGKPLMTIVDNENLEIDIIAPSAWLSWLKNGTSFSFSIDETGDTLSAKVKRLGAEVDAISQTIQLIATFENSPHHVLPGMSGNATFLKTSQPTQ